MLKCIIVDDEPACIETLQLMLNRKFADTVQVAATALIPADAILLIQQHRPDIVFLDVEMPQMSGIELLQSFDQISFQVIFTTAHQHYALQAIKLNALDYLLKPISLDELSEAINKALSRKANYDPGVLYTFLQQLKPGNAQVKRIAISSNDTTQFVPVNDIVRIESKSNYSTVYFISRPKLLVAKTLKEFEDQLLSYDFLRVHQSHLINLAHVVGYKNQDGGYVIMHGNESVEISRRKKQEVMQRLNMM
jgi:two-component system LytT family response regulator